MGVGRPFLPSHAMPKAADAADMVFVVVDGGLVALRQHNSIPIHQDHKCN